MTARPFASSFTLRTVPSPYWAPGTSQTPVETSVKEDCRRAMAYSSVSNGAFFVDRAVPLALGAAVAQKGTCQSSTKEFTAPPVLMAWVM